MAGIKHKATKVRGEKGLATEWNDDHEITGNVDQDQNQFLNAVIENRTDWPAGPVEGQRVWRSDLKLLYIYDGADWIQHTPPIGAGTHYYSIPTAAFTAQDPETDDIEIRETFVRADGIGIKFLAPVYLPQGAIVTACIVYGNPATEFELWTLGRSKNDSLAYDEMAKHNMNKEDVTINNAEIDNENYGYVVFTSTLDEDDIIYGARITYTL